MSMKAAVLGVVFALATASSAISTSAHAGPADKVATKVLQWAGKKLVEKGVIKSIPKEGKLHDGTMRAYQKELERTIEVGERSGRTG